MSRTQLGIIIDGSFNAGLTARLHPNVSTEHVRIGDFVIIEGKENLYFSMINDMKLRATDAWLTASSPSPDNTSTYATVEVKPMQMMPKDRGDNHTPCPVRTIPMHLSPLAQATKDDFRMVFGDESKDKQHFAMGRALTMDIPICINLGRLIERSNGVFGQSGTGKSFLVRILLSGVIKQGIAVNLIFDMHNEYAFGKQSEDGHFVKGLTHHFGRSKILVYSLDRKAISRGGGRGADRTIQIGLDQIEPEDIMLIAEELNLRGTAEATIGLLQDRFRIEWLANLLSFNPDELKDFSIESGAHIASLRALQRALRVFQRKDYMVTKGNFNLIDEMVQILDRGQNVIVHYGQHDTLLDHVLVANLITRRVRHLYRAKAERYEQTQAAEDKPRPLMITIEEAHCFLNPAASKQTIFGVIARELRKYHVTLMVIDQRPSTIDAEVMSQLGTRITGKLTEERDIDAVLTGVGSRSSLRGALESLATREQVLLMGHAVPMPISIRTRKYDETFHQAMIAEQPDNAQEAIKELFGP